MTDRSPLPRTAPSTTSSSRPQRSPVLTRRDVDLSMPLAAGLAVGLPVIGANMDTVMGEEMAQDPGPRGGLRVPPPEPQHRGPGGADPLREEPALVRHREARAPPEDRDHGARPGDHPRPQRQRHPDRGRPGQRASWPGSCPIGTCPCVDGSDERPVTDFMTPAPRIVTRPPNVAMDEAERVMFDHRVEKLPLVDADGRIRGLITMRDLKLYKQKPQSAKDARGRLRVGAAIGATGDFLERAAALRRGGSRRDPDGRGPRRLRGGGEGDGRVPPGACPRPRWSSATWPPPTGRGACATRAPTRSRWESAPGAAAGPGSRPGPECPSSRRSARPGAGSKGACRSSPTAGCAPTRTSSWPSPAAPPR